MKLFITGAAGRLGQAVATQAQHSGFTLIGIDMKPWPANVQMPKALQFHQSALDHTDLLDRLLPGCDGIISAAGLTGDHITTHTQDAFIEANVSAIARLLDKAVQHNIKGVALSSTMEVLIGRNGQASGPALLNESFPIQADSTYSISKCLMEELARRFARTHPISIASLRYMAFGYKGGFNPRLLSRTLSAQDAARAAILACTTHGLPGEVFNIGPLSPLTPNDIPQAILNPGDLIERIYPRSTQTLLTAGFPPLQTSDLLPATSIQKACTLLNWRPIWTFPDWLATLTPQPSSRTSP